MKNIDSYLIKHYATAPMEKLIKTTGLEPRQLRNKVTALRKKGHNIPFREATAKKTQQLTEYLIKHYPKKSVEEIAEIMGYSASGVYDRLAALRSEGKIVGSRAALRTYRPKLTASEAHQRLLERLRYTGDINFLLRQPRQYLVKTILTLREEVANAKR